MEIALSRISTRVTGSISYKNNRYATSIGLPLFDFDDLEAN